MKKKSKSSESLKRVSKLLDDHKKSIEDPSSPKKEKPHTYQLEQPPPLPHGIDQLSLQDNWKAPSKRPLGNIKVIPQSPHSITLEQMHCSVNQNYPLFFIEKSEAFHLKKVKNFKTKERLIAARNIKKLSLEMQQWIYSQIYRDVKVLGKDPVEFCDLIEKREERHFRIDRIIKYLSDI